jgi:ribose/xylose/arabinose/galactoside ABC-type transport system permease subunit
VREYFVRILRWSPWRNHAAIIDQLQNCYVILVVATGQRIVIPHTGLASGVGAFVKFMNLATASVCNRPAAGRR